MVPPRMNPRARAGKRPTKNLSPAEKLAAIQMVRDGTSKASVAREISVPESTLRGWCKSESKLRLMVQQQQLQRQSMSTSTSPETSNDSMGRRAKKPRLSPEIPSVSPGLVSEHSAVAAVQPFNLSVRTSPTNVQMPPNYSSSPSASECLSAPLDFSRTTDLESSRVPQNLSRLQETPRAAGCERNKAELSRIGIECGLKKPEGASDLGSSKRTGLPPLSNEMMGMLLRMQSQNNLLATLPTEPAIAAAISTFIQNRVAQMPNIPFSALPMPPNLLLDDPRSCANLVRNWQMLNACNNSAQLPPPSPILPNLLRTEIPKRSPTAPKRSPPAPKRSPPAHKRSPPPATVTSGALSASASSNSHFGTAALNGFSNPFLNPPPPASLYPYNDTKYHMMKPETVNSSHSPAEATPMPASTERPILYKQLTKDTTATGSDIKPKEEATTEKLPSSSGSNTSNGMAMATTEKLPSPSGSNTSNGMATKVSKGRAVLDSLLIQRNTSNIDQNEEVITAREAIRHGEVFLRWVEEYSSNPNVTAHQITQFRTLLNNIKAGTERKNGVVPDQKNRTNKRK